MRRKKKVPGFVALIALVLLIAGGPAYAQPTAMPSITGLVQTGELVAPVMYCPPLVVGLRGYNTPGQEAAAGFKAVLVFLGPFDTHPFIVFTYEDEADPDAGIVTAYIDNDHDGIADKVYDLLPDENEGQVICAQVTKQRV